MNAPLAAAPTAPLTVMAGAPRSSPRSRACCRRTRCWGSARTPRPTNATASPPTASGRSWWRCRRPRRRCRPCCAPATRSACRWSRAAPAPGCRAARLPHADGVTLSLAKFNRILQIDPRRAHRHRAVRRAQPRDQRGGRAARPVLRARSVEPDRLHHRRQRRRELRRRALPEVRPDAAQRAAGARLHGRRRAGRSSAREALDAPGLRPAVRRRRQRGHAGRHHRSHGASCMPKPQLARCIMASFDDVRKAGDAVAAIIAAGIIPAGLEMMDKPMTAAVEDFVHAGYDLDAAAILLCESDGTPEEVEEEIGRMSEVLRACRRHAPSRSARDEAERLQVLERPQERLPGLGPHQPRLHVHGLDHPAQAPGRHPAGDPGRWRRSTDLRCCNVFHAGDGNLHPLILFDANDADQLHRGELFGADILETSVAMGGTVSGRARRGRGEAQLDVRAVQRRRRREQMLGVKRAFDPRRPAESGQGDPDACSAAPSTASMLVPARRCSRSPNSRVSDEHDDTACSLVERVRAAAATGDAAAHPRRRHQGLLRRADRRGEPLDTAPLTPASSTTSRASWSSPCAPARRWSSWRRCSPPRPVPAVRAAALREPTAGAGTVGGMVAAGLAGPARAGVGGVRDYVLGAVLLNGRGELLRFGGTGHEERGRLRRLAPARRLAGQRSA